MTVLKFWPGALRLAVLNEKEQNQVNLDETEGFCLVFPVLKIFQLYSSVRLMCHFGVFLDILEEQVAAVA